MKTIISVLLIIAMLLTGCSGGNKETSAENLYIYNNCGITVYSLSVNYVNASGETKTAKAQKTVHGSAAAFEAEKQPALILNIELKNDDGRTLYTKQFICDFTAEEPVTLYIVRTAEGLIDISDKKGRVLSATDVSRCEAQDMMAVYPEYIDRITVVSNESETGAERLEITSPESIYDAVRKLQSIKITNETNAPVGSPGTARYEFSHRAGRTTTFEYSDGKLRINGKWYNAENVGPFHDTIAKKYYVNASGDTIETRINLPAGYTRTEGNIYERFIREQKVEPDGTAVHLYNGDEKYDQDSHFAVLSTDVGEDNLQYCANAALRLRAEFLYSTNQYERIQYKTDTGLIFAYTDYRDGSRINVNEEETYLARVAEYDDTYNGFKNYLGMLFDYSTTIALSAESTTVPIEEMRVGDIFVEAGSPGSCLMVMDLCENGDGEKAFILGGSYSPAEQIHILTNPKTNSPWFYVSDIQYPMQIHEHSFRGHCLKRMP